MSLVPIIMQTYNRLSYTAEVIAAFKNHILYPHKVIIVDNGSTDGTVEYLQMMYKLGFIDYLVLNKENKGIAEPKNQGLSIAKEIAKSEDVKYVCITDNDIVPPFIRDTDGGCVLGKIVQVMENHPYIGMCGVDLTRDNAPDNQEWWWRLRQHPLEYPVFAEISIGFWFSVFKMNVFDDFEFSGESLYGRVDESIRNYLSFKKHKIGLLKGISIVENGKHKETSPRLGVHLGWTEDYVTDPDYVNFKKTERCKAEEAWREKGKKW